MTDTDCLNVVLMSTRMSNASLLGVPAGRHQLINSFNPQFRDGDTEIRRW